MKGIGKTDENRRNSKMTEESRRRHEMTEKTEEAERKQNRIGNPEENRYYTSSLARGCTD